MLDYIEKQQILDVEVLSIDTAINAAMNVHDDKLWTFLLNLARQGRLLALVLGPPCET